MEPSCGRVLSTLLTQECDVALQQNGRAPYTTAAAATAVLDAWRDRTRFDTPITADILTRAGISESISRRTLQSLRELELVDDSGQPTPVFEAFRQTRVDEQYREDLQNWLRDIYADILRYGDPSTDDPHHIQEAFQTYEPAGQRPAMTSLLVGLWRYAGLPVAASEASSRPTKTASKTRTPRKRAHKGTDSSIGPVGELPSGLVGLLHQIPEPGESWTSERRKSFLTAFEATLDFTIRVDEEPQQVAQGKEREDAS